MVTPICSSETLDPLIESIKEVREVCLDLEADSLYHYFEKVCLLQFTISKDDPADAAHFLIDPLANFELKPLFEVLKNKLLIIHGADYDLRLLWAKFRFSPTAIFDTMFAARLAGHTKFGLDALVQRYTGYQLDHGAQKADWSQRPLPQRLLSYAVNDTRFLPILTQKLREELTALGRVEWHHEQCQQLIEISAVDHRKDPVENWRIRNSSTLDRRSLAVLRELWKWRDKEAQRIDRPVYMIWHDQKLLEFVKWIFSHPHHNLESCPLLSKRWLSSRKHALEITLKRAWELPASEWPLPVPRGKRPIYDPEFNRHLKQLRLVRDKVGETFQLEPSILAPQAMLEAIVLCKPKRLEDFALIQKWLPWQTKLLGQIFLDALKS